METCTHAPKMPRPKRSKADDVCELAATLPPISTGNAAAAIVGLSPRYMANLRVEGKGPAYLKPNNGRVLYTAQALAEWILSA